MQISVTLFVMQAYQLDRDQSPAELLLSLRKSAEYTPRLLATLCRAGRLPILAALTPTHPGTGRAEAVAPAVCVHRLQRRGSTPSGSRSGGRSGRPRAGRARHFVEPLQAALFAAPRGQSTASHEQCI